MLLFGGVGLLAVIACVIQCLMDMQFFCLCAWLMDGWMDGWMDGRTDGWMLCKSRRKRVRGRAQRLRAMQTKFLPLLGLLVAWWVCWLGRVVAWLGLALR